MRATGIRTAETLFNFPEPTFGSDTEPKQIVQDIGQIMNLAWGLGRTGILIAALELKIFNYIAHGDRTPQDIAQRINADVQGIHILLESLNELGFVYKEGENYLLAKHTLAYLVDESPLYVGHLWKVHKYLNWKVWDKLAESIQLGKPVENLFSFENNQLWQVVIPYLDSLAKPIALYIIDLLNLAAKDQKISILDVGCGSGIYGQMFAKSNPNIRVVGIDQGNVIKIAETQASQLGIESQVEYVNADFNQIEFGEGFDLILFSNIFHGFDRETNVKLMQKAFSALKNSGSIIINEFLKYEKDGIVTDVPAILSLHFYLVGQGKVYNFHEYEDWLNLSGFNPVQHYPLSGLSSIIIGHKSAND